MSHEYKITKSNVLIPLGVVLSLLITVFFISQDYSLVKKTAVDADERSKSNEQDIDVLKDSLLPDIKVIKEQINVINDNVAELKKK